MYYPHTDGIICGDFNMVEDNRDTATCVGIMLAQEKHAWSMVMTQLRLHDIWRICHANAPGYTYHSVSHARAWSRLDRIYIVGMDSLPPSCDMTICSAMHISDHWPLMMQLHKYDWKAAMVGMCTNRPLMINNLHISHVLFKSYVLNLVDHMQAMPHAPLGKWLYFITKMQNVIHICQKTFAQRSKKHVQSAKDIVSNLQNVGSTRQLSEIEECALASHIKILIDNDSTEATKAQFLS